MPHPYNNPMLNKLKQWRKKAGRWLRLGLLAVLIMIFFEQGSENPTTLPARVLAATRGHTFNYVQWEAEALLSKAQQEAWGFHAYIPEKDRSQLVLDYFALQTQLWGLESQIEQATSQNSDRADLQRQQVELESQLSDLQPLVEHIIEGQVSSVLREEGFAFLGQVLPPVTMHFLDIPDVLVVSPRHEIRQAMTVTLQPMDFNQRVALEAHIAAAVPDLSVWITPIGGVGVYPSMVTETDRAVIAFEITAHEWTHHYLIFFPLGYEYLSDPETRIINETTATLVGNEIGNKVLERFYSEALAAGQVYLQEIPDYRVLLAAVEGTSIAPNAVEGWNPSPLVQAPQRASKRLLADYLLSVKRPAAAQVTLDLWQQQVALLGITAPLDPNTPRTDPGGWVSHTRLTVDYLFALGMVEAGEAAMATGRQQAGLRVLNQAWFAFNAGYQDNPVVQQQPDGTATLSTSGGGGDPIGAAIYEIRARAGSLERFLSLMRGITTRQELLDTLATLRAK